MPQSYSFRCLSLLFMMSMILASSGCVDTSPMLPVDPVLLELECEQCPALVAVPSGTFLLGTPPDESGRVEDEGPQKRIAIAAFAVSRYEITRGEFAQFVAATDYNDHSGCLVMGDNSRWVFDPDASWHNPGFAQDDNHPVVCVTTDAAEAYVAWLNHQSGADAYRLLSESEWEYVARAGSTTPYWWGEVEDDFCRFANGVDQSAATEFPGWIRAGNCNDGNLYTAAVGRYRANPFGLYDTAGNVWEWVADCYVDHYATHPDDGAPVVIDRCDKRVMRGGGWADYGSFYLRTGYRGAWSGAQPFGNIGFRVAADLDPSGR